jgi:Peptidase family S58
MRRLSLLVGCGLMMVATGRAGEPLSHSLVVASFRTGDAELFLIDPDTGDARNLTRSPRSKERYPSCSPDGSLIEFDSDRDGTHNLYDPPDGLPYRGSSIVAPIHRVRTIIGMLVVGVVAMGFDPAVSPAADPPRPRARDLGIDPGVFPPGPLNAITDVEGVRVGHVTLNEGKDIRTGVTAILPHGGNLFQEKVAGAVFVGNAFGKLAGSTQVEELGTIETPIILTNTLSVGTAVEAVVAHTLRQKGNESVRSVNALVGETNDGGLNDIRGQHVRREHVWQAIDSAATGPVAEG